MAKQADTVSEAEAIKRREKALKRMLATPPTRHTNPKVPHKPRSKSRPAARESNEA